MSDAPHDKSHDKGQVHVYDDIVEEDNRLPNWWLYTLFGTIVFAVVYWLYYQAYAVDPGPVAAYQAERRAERKAEEARVLAAGEITEEGLVELSKTPAALAEGKKVYAEVCAACHRTDGGGQVGPNLTDSAWIHGGKPLEIARTIRDGVPAKGMLAWGPQLGELKVRAVTAYVLTLRDTNVAGGKPPQGPAVEPAK
ncbi:MAG: c-type cytochrome [Proteobacteria bacterium]|nr:c-type cytochrome [Pseudomonadota bacterium]